MDEDAGWEEEAMVPAIEDGLVTTEFFTIQLPETWEGRYECEIIPDEPAGYSLNFYDLENGECFFAIDAVWFDDVPLEMGEGETYLGRIDVVRLGQPGIGGLYRGRKRLCAGSGGRDCFYAVGGRLQLC